MLAWSQAWRFQDQGTAFLRSRDDQRPDGLFAPVARRARQLDPCTTCSASGLHLPRCNAKLLVYVARSSAHQRDAASRAPRHCPARTLPPAFTVANLHRLVRWMPADIDDTACAQPVLDSCTAGSRLRVRLYCVAAVLGSEHLRHLQDPVARVYSAFRMAKSNRCQLMARIDPNALCSVPSFHTMFSNVVEHIHAETLADQGCFFDARRVRSRFRVAAWHGRARFGTLLASWRPSSPRASCARFRGARA